jgi:hypothetical protein
MYTPYSINEFLRINGHVYRLSIAGKAAFIMLLSFFVIILSSLNPAFMFYLTLPLISVQVGGRKDATFMRSFLAPLRRMKGCQLRVLLALSGRWWLSPSLLRCTSLTALSSQ